MTACPALRRHFGFPGEQHAQALAETGPVVYRLSPFEPHRFRPFVRNHVFEHGPVGAVEKADRVQHFQHILLGRVHGIITNMSHMIHIL